MFYHPHWWVFYFESLYLDPETKCVYFRTSICWYIQELCWLLRPDRVWCLLKSDRRCYSHTTNVICNVIILSDHGNIHLGTYDSFADAALRLYLHLYDIQSNKGSLGWCIKTLTYIPLQIIPEPHWPADVLQRFPPFLDVKRLVSIKLECYILFKTNTMLH